MKELHLKILQELARLKTKKEREEAITEILNLLDDIMDGKLLPEQEGSSGTPVAKELQDGNPFDGRILWSR